MKNSLTLVFLITLSIVQGQFQEQFNLNYGIPLLRNERFNSGMQTKVNFSGGVPANYYLASVGTSYKNTALMPPNNVADRMRFTLLNAQGAVIVNKGYQFSVNGNSWLNSIGNSIAEINNGAGSGGFVTAGAVSDNGSQATVLGGSDVLFTHLSAAGVVLSASKIDINGGKDYAWCIRRSQVVTAAGNPTWILCGQSSAINSSDCFVARVDINGTIIWCRRYNFPLPNGNPTYCVAKQLCEDVNNDIYVVGTRQIPNGATTDGLVYKIGPAGALGWSKSYHVNQDLKFEAVRLLNGGNSIVIGGHITNGVMSNMLVLQILANGAIGFRNMLKAQDAAGNVYPSQCFGLVQITGGNLFLAGFLIKNGVNIQMMYKVSPGGVGLNWYSYNKIWFKEGFDVDYINALVPGIALFSSINTLANPPSDSHIMQTNLSGQVCPDFCNAQLPVTVQIGIENTDHNCVPVNAGAREILNNLPVNYDRILICTGLCPAAAIQPSANDSQTQSSLETSGSLKIFPDPVTGFAHIRFNSLPSGNYQLTVLNMKGELLLQKNSVFNNGSSVTSLDMSAFAPGMYLITVKKDKLIMQQRIVKQ